MGKESPERLLMFCFLESIFCHILQSPPVGADFFFISPQVEFMLGMINSGWPGEDKDP